MFLPHRPCALDSNALLWVSMGSKGGSWATGVPGATHFEIVYRMMKRSSCYRDALGDKGTLLILTPGHFDRSEEPRASQGVA
ncbi:UNVERIFIED_CONTAM: hypothetical protein Slati_4606800 [Sesamum latifolium]|uniref:Uncharacterized protein n=1 Tax=Sesamum latifolium TaxID=2727402 RepID=A0AAW2S3Z5_9LAMI